MQQHQEQLGNVRRENDARIQQIQQHLSETRRGKDAQIQQVQQQLTDTRREKEAQTQQLQQQLADLRRDKEAQIQQLQVHLSDVRRDNERLHQGVGPNTSPIHSQEIEFCRVSPEEVQVGQEILGRGAWGVVAKGNFEVRRLLSNKCIQISFSKRLWIVSTEKSEPWHRCVTQTWCSSLLQ